MEFEEYGTKIHKPFYYISWFFVVKFQEKLRVTWNIKNVVFWTIK